MSETTGLAAALRADVEALCQPRGRVVGTAGHDVARRWLRGRIEELGLEPYGQSVSLPYRADGVEGVNLVGVLPGRDRGAAPLLLGAHYDSAIEGACADDNGAAVAILLAMAGRLSGASLQRDLVLAFFDGEEPPHYLTPTMGSIRFYGDQMDARGVHAAVVLDLVGHDLPVETLSGMGFAVPGTGRLRDLVFMTGAESHPHLQHVVRDCGLPGGLPLVATRDEHVGDMSDYAVFRWNGRPFLFFSCGRWQHYHQPSDTPEKLNYDKMARLTGYLERLIDRLDKADLQASAAPEPPRLWQPISGFLGGGQGPEIPVADTTEFEIETLERSFGPVLMPVLKKLAGVGKLRSRDDLDAIANVLAGAGL